MTTDCYTLDRIGDERAIERLIARYGHALDFGGPDEVVALFVPDGSVTIRSVWVGPEDGDTSLPYEQEGLASGAVREGNALVWRGRDAIRAFVSGGASDRRTLHVCSQIIVTHIERDQAHAESYVRVYVQSRGGAPAIAAFGRYHDVLQRTGAGWRILTRLCEVG